MFAKGFAREFNYNAHLMDPVFSQGSTSQSEMSLLLLWSHSSR